MSLDNHRLKVSPSAIIRFWITVTDDGIEKRLESHDITIAPSHAAMIVKLQTPGVGIVVLNK